MSVLSTATQATFHSLEWKFNEARATQEDIQREAVSDQLAENLSLVFNVGKEIGDAETLQAILLQETHGGMIPSLIGNKDSPVGKRSYGLMQVQVCAARSILSRNSELVDAYFPDRTYKSLADEEIIAVLLTNKEANVRIAAYHFKLYKSLAKGNWARTVAGYNAGEVLMQKLQHPEQFGYVVEVKQKLTTTVKQFNKDHGLQLTQRF
jgi:hypothetical protein